MGNEQLTEPGRSSAVVASLQPPETVGSALRADARPTEKSCSDCRSSKEIHDDSPEFIGTMSARMRIVEEHVTWENEHNLDGIMDTFGETARYDDEGWGAH